MPFITEEIWQNISTRQSGDSISVSRWPNIKLKEIDEKILIEFTHLFQLVGALRKIRQEKNIPFKESLTLLTDNKDVFKHEVILKKMSNVNKLNIYDGKQNNQLLPFLIGSSKYFVPVSLTFDVNKEIKKR